MWALKSLIEMDQVIQLTPAHLGILYAVEAVTLGYCDESLSHLSNAPVFTVFITFNWTDLPYSKDFLLTIFMEILSF